MFRHCACGILDNAVTAFYDGNGPIGKIPADVFACASKPTSTTPPGTIWDFSAAAAPGASGPTGGLPCGTTFQFAALTPSIKFWCPCN